MEISYYGIRHHGPGSARSLRNVLSQNPPDLLLIEGPPEANDLLALAVDEMQPPVAMLLYEKNDPANSVLYPFAEFSPEWVAIQFARRRGIPCRFIDLPAEVLLAEKKALLEKLRAFENAEPLATPAPEESKVDDAEAAPPAGIEEESEENGAGEADPATSPEIVETMEDPIAELARADHYDDPERWWNDRIEERSADENLFPAIEKAMSVARQAREESHGPPSLRERQREAHMRKVIRAARNDAGLTGKIAVVCGAWHVPALNAPKLPAVKDDNALLSGLPKTSVLATWIPWSHSRLRFASGYGAGIHSPGWYLHLWQYPDRPVIHWITRAVRLLREKDFDGSSAHAIEAVRLAETLAAMREKASPGLQEMHEALRTVATGGYDEPLQLIESPLLIAERFGTVPENVVSVPLQKDLEKEQKRLRLKPAAEKETEVLDLRKEMHLERSRLLHRLRILGIHWGTPQKVEGQGTFKEGWTLLWEPEFAIKIIEAAPLGNTVEQAAAASIRQQVETLPDLAPTVKLFDQALLAGLETAAMETLAQVQARAAISRDIEMLLDSYPALSFTLQYGDVRKTPKEPVRALLDEMAIRIEAGLVGACSGLDDEKSRGLTRKLQEYQRVFQLLEKESAAWDRALESVADNHHFNGILCGLSTRLLQQLRPAAADLHRRMSFALSRTDYGFSSRWLEGFLTNYGVILLHDARLLGLLDDWLRHQSPEVFAEMLPLVRRTFATFEAPLRRKLGLKLKQGLQPSMGLQPSAVAETQLDQARVDMVWPILRTILGDKATPVSTAAGSIPHPPL